MTAVQLTRFMHSRHVLLIMAVALVCVTVLSFHIIPIDHIAGDRGILFPSANLWIADAKVAMWVNVGVTLLLAYLMVVINRTYNLLRSSTLLDTSLFLLMCMSTPWLLDQFYTGTPLCLCLLLCLLLLYSTYQNSLRRDRIFLIFFLLSAMTMTQYCYAVYIPVFIIGCFQMRIFSLKTLAAILMGIISPWFVVLGCGIVPLDGIHAPDIAKAFGTFNIVENVPLVIAVIVGTLVLLVGWCLNFPRMIAYNAHIRAYNGTMSVLALVTVLALCVDFINLPAYAPVLYVCASFFFGRMLAASASPRGYIPVITIISIYTALLVWTLMP